jgi:erythrocyte band 7 integral membrane protein
MTQMSASNDIDSRGRIHPRQEPPSPIVAMRRTQKTYAIEAPGDYEASNDPCYEGMLTCLGCFCGDPSVLLFPQVTSVQRSPFKEVKQGSIGLITKFSKFVRAIDPGLYKINPFWY